MQPFRLVSQTIKHLRTFLEQLNLEEIRVPNLVESGAMEPYLEPLHINSVEGHPPYVLPTSPEFALKRAMAFVPQSMNGVFAIAPAYRDETKSKLHALEFTMAEWYLRDHNYLQFSSQISDLCAILEKNLPGFQSAAKIAQLTLREAFEITLGLKLPPGAESDFYKNANEKYNLGSWMNELLPEENCSAFFFLLLDNQVLPELQQEFDLLVLYDFPSFSRGMANLSQTGFAQRIEFYFRGIEIANGYSEMYDADEILKLWEGNNRIRKMRKVPEHKIDRSLLEFSAAMRGVAGIALGVERLIMAGCKISDIRNFQIP